MSFLSKFRHPSQPQEPLTEQDKQGAPGHHFSPAAAPERARLTVRRAPSLLAFAITGLLVGLALAFAVTALGPENPNYTFGAVFGVMAVLFGTLCTTVAIGIALFLDRRSSRHTKTYQAVSTKK